MPLQSAPIFAAADSAMGKNENKRKPGLERRRWPRLKASSVPFLKGVILGQGTEVQAIDISRGGMLLETEVRLPPQTRIYVKMVTIDGVVKMDATVLRSSIASLTGVPRYQSAISFDHPFHMLDDLSQESVAAAPEAGDESNPSSSLHPGNSASVCEPIALESAENTANLLFFAQDLSEASLREILKQNDW